MSQALEDSGLKEAKMMKQQWHTTRWRAGLLVLCLSALSNVGLAVTERTSPAAKDKDMELVATSGAHLNEEALADLHLRSDAIGADTRGRTLYQDTVEFMAAAERGELLSSSWRTTDPNTQFAWLSSYWLQLEKLANSRRMWSSFLSMNHLPDSQPRSNDVQLAEQALASTAIGNFPAPEWADKVARVNAAYLEERIALVKQIHLPVELKPRAAVCPANDKVAISGKATPKLDAERTPSTDSFYPAASTRAGEEGSVVLSFLVNERGCVTELGVRGSSGSSKLDQAAMTWLEAAVFKPGEQNNQPVAARSDLVVSFRLSR